ncbi:MAG TPA: hypothetical protein VKE41_00870 [Roseiflexaceae bacterium]|nr:hypothetical protein [Roseiflexaceae bacterium]
MKTVNLSNPTNELTALLDQANDEDIVVRLADGREFLLSAVDDFAIEIAQTRQNEKLMALLEERARQTHTLPLDEVKRRLGIAE